MDENAAGELQMVILKHDEALSRLRGQAAAVNLVVRALIARDPTLAQALRRAVAQDAWQDEMDEHARDCFRREIESILGPED